MWWIGWPLGGRWHCVDGCGSSGVVDDPSASPLAVAAVLDGRRLYPRRADLQAVIAVDDPARSAELAAAVERQAATRKAAHRADPRRAAAAATCRTRWPPPRGSPAGNRCRTPSWRELGCALTDAQVRDMLYALAVGENAGEVESLWAVLARTLPQPWRVEALVLLAFSAYARGDGPLAGVSLEAALRCEPDHRMAGMLDTALQSGLRPRAHSANSRTPATGWRNGSGCGCRRVARSAGGRVVARVGVVRPFRP